MNLRPEKTDHTWNVPTIVSILGLAFTVFTFGGASLWWFAQFVGNAESTMQRNADDIRDIKRTLGRIERYLPYDRADN